MKFGNGCWLQKEGYECFPPQQVYFTKVEEDKVTLLAPTSRISHRGDTLGDTLGGINLTLEITSPMPEVLRVKTYHHLGIRQVGPEFELEPNKNVPLEVEDEISEAFRDLNVMIQDIIEKETTAYEAKIKAQQLVNQQQQMEFKMLTSQILYFWISVCQNLPDLM